MAAVFGPLDEMLPQLLETCNRRYDFQFDREKRAIIFARGDMIAQAVEPIGPGEGQGLIVVSYRWGTGETEHEFCTPGQAADLIDAVMARKDLCRLPKYGRPPMLILEFFRDSAQALAMEFYPESAEAFAQVLPRAKSALLNWKANYGKRCEAVLFTVVSVVENHAAIQELIRQVCRQDAELGPLLQSLELRVALHDDARADPIKEYIVA
jgi:hypothetical protein